MKTRDELIQQAAGKLEVVIENNWFGDELHHQALGFCDAIAAMFGEDKYDIRGEAADLAEKNTGICVCNRRGGC